MEIDRDLVLHIAKLARLELNEEEIRLFCGQLQEIVNYIEKLQEVKQPAETFSYHQLIGERPDRTTTGLSQEEALKNAPDRVNHFFKVPRIVS